MLAQRLSVIVLDMYKINADMKSITFLGQSTSEDTDMTWVDLTHELTI